MFDYLLTKYKDGKQPQFCSTSCVGSYNQIAYRPLMRNTFRQTELECSQCGEHFFRPQSQINRVKHGRFFCSPECKITFQNKRSPKVNEMKYGAIRKELLKLTEGKCQECGYDKRPDLLRIWYRNQSPEIIRPDNVQLLCPNCFTEHQIPVQLAQRNRALTKENRGKHGLNNLIKNKKGTGL